MSDRRKVSTSVKKFFSYEKFFNRKMARLLGCIGLWLIAMYLLVKELTPLLTEERVAIINFFNISHSFFNREIQLSILDLFLIIILLVAIIYGTKIIYRRFRPKTTKRDFDFLKNELTSDNPRSFATDINDLIDKIVDGGISDSDRKTIEKHIQPKIDRIANFINDDGAKDSVILVDGTWGSGKTTAVMLGLEKGNQKNYRYIYSSAFKYTSATSEFGKDVVSSIFDTLRNSGLLIDKGVAEAILNNIDSRSGKILLSLNQEKENEGTVTPELIRKINKTYTDSFSNLKIIIIIDDMDRLQGEDVLKTISLLSILRKFSFVKIIIPADLDAIKAMLEKADVYSPETFVNKYLPECSTVKISYGRQFVGQIVIQKIIAAQSEKRSPETYNPAWAAILFGLFSEKLRKLTAGTKYEDYDWIRNYSKSGSSTDISKRLKAIYSAKGIAQKSWPTGQFRNEHGYPINQEYGFRTMGGATFESVLMAIYDQTKGTLVCNDFSEISYIFTVEIWIFKFTEKNWQEIGITIRDVLDFVNKFDLEGLSEKPGKQFAEMFNRIFGEGKIVYKETKSDDDKKPKNNKPLGSQSPINLAKKK